MKPTTEKTLQVLLMTNEHLVGVLDAATKDGITEFPVPLVKSALEAVVLGLKSALAIESDNAEAVHKAAMDTVDALKRELTVMSPELQDKVEAMMPNDEWRKMISSDLGKRVKAEIAETGHPKPETIQAIKENLPPLDDKFINPCTHCKDEHGDDSNVGCTIENPHGLVMCSDCFGQHIYKADVNAAVIIRRYCVDEECQHKPGLIYNPSAHYAIMRRPLYDMKMAVETLELMKPSRKDAEQAIEMMSGSLPGDRDFDPTNNN